ncbi:MAG: AMP-dependent synthetase/ligase [Solirubrobacterales bacterium]
MEVTTSERYASGGELGELYAPNLVKSFYKTVDRLGDDVAIRTQDGSYEISWSELRDRMHRIAGGLAKLGVKKGDTVALMLNNRPEFIPCDLGAVALGGVPFSVYQTSSPEQIEYVCDNAGAKVAIVETAFLEQFNKAREGLSVLEHLVVIDGEGGDHTLEELEAMDPGFDPADAVEEIGPDDLLTLIYTSGTTGPPKGVQLTHRNLMALTAGVEGMINLPDRGAKVISWLPAAHIAERGAHYYLPVNQGLTVTVCPDPRKIGESLAAVKPTWFFAVPRVWEKMKAGIEAQIHSMPDEARAKAQGALDAAIKKVRLEQAGEKVPEELAAAVAQAEEQMFARFRAAIGLDEAVAVNSGAAPCPVEVLEFFHAIGVPVGELWGMSETCGVVTCNPPDNVGIGTVGPPIPGAEVKLAEDGEVLVKSPSVMPGYRNMPDKNAETFTEDGWLVTGDIGELDEDGYLKIVDRKKELIITAGGKNVSPANLEAELKMIPLVGQACAIGEQRPFMSALVVLDPDAAAAWAASRGLTGDDAKPSALAENADVVAEINEGLVEVMSGFNNAEAVKKVRILGDEWLPDSELLTPTSKLKRRGILAKFADEIEDLYAK